VSYLTQHPCSLANPSGKHRVVDYRDWVRYTSGEISSIPAAGEFDNDADAVRLRDRLNNAERELYAFYPEYREQQEKERLLALDVETRELRALADVIVIHGEDAS
jgi:hypothetical protein